MAAACTGGGSESGADGDEPRPEVAIASSTAAAGHVQGEVYAILLTELGYNVRRPLGDDVDTGLAYTSLAGGEIDVWTDGRYPADEGWHGTTLADGSEVAEHITVVGEPLDAVGIEGLVITRSVAEREGIRSLDQINDDPALVEMFDSDGNGKANVFGCPDIWVCGDVIDAMIERNGWDNLEQTRSQYRGMAIESSYRVADDLPIIQYLRTPTGQTAERFVPGDNVLWLSLGGSDLACDHLAPCDPAWDTASREPVPADDTCTDIPCFTGWNEATVRLVANARFAEDNPSAMALLTALSSSGDAAVATHAAYLEVTYPEPEDLEAAARQWIRDHRSEVDTWLDEARAEG